MSINEYKRRTAVLVMIVLAIGINSISANESEYKRTSLTQSASANSEAIYSAWGISESEYLRYKEIMRGKRGVWTPDADPILALGVESKSEAQRRQYAELHVRQTFARVERELAFQREVDAAWERLYPDTPRIRDMVRDNTRQASANNSPVADRAAIVVTQQCQACQPVIKKYLKYINGQHTIKAIDIYISDSAGDDAALQQWVENNGVTETLLRDGRVTVNHAKQHAAITRYPTVYEHGADGQWREKH